MSILAELNTLFTPLLPIETGVFSGVPPDEYIVITPMSETFEVFADNKPQIEVQEARLSLFSKNNYQQRKRQIVKMLLDADITITDRRYIGHENDSGYHHFAIDVAHEFGLEG